MRRAYVVGGFSRVEILVIAATYVLVRTVLGGSLLGDVIGYQANSSRTIVVGRAHDIDVELDGGESEPVTIAPEGQPRTERSRAARFPHELVLSFSVRSAGPGRAIVLVGFWARRGLMQKVEVAAQ
jgi:hypothetical protein